MNDLQSNKFSQQYSNDSIKDKVLNTVNDVVNWLKINWKKVAIVIGVIIGLIIIIQIFKKKEKFQAETPNGILSQKTTYVPGQGPVSTMTYGDKIVSKPLSIEGVDMNGLMSKTDTVASLTSSKQAEQNIKTEMYMGMAQNTFQEDIESNIIESDAMQMLKNSANNIQIEKDNNIGNSNLINNLDLLRQQTALKQMPLQDVNELEQVNRDTQTMRDHQSLIQASRGAGMQIAPNDPNQIIKERVKYVYNSGRPTSQAFLEQKEPIHQEMEFAKELDVKKEVDIKTNGPSVDLPNMSKVENEMKTTQITQEPIVQSDQQKVILAQDVIQLPDNKQSVVVEKTVNPEIIAKVEQYSRWPSTLSTQTQKDAAGQYMTILILMKYAGVQIPSFMELVSKFPQLEKMKPSGFFKGFPPEIVRWAEQQRQSVISGQNGLENIISQYKALYNINPVQQTVSGKVMQDGSIEKEVIVVQQPLTQKVGEAFSMQNTKKKFIIKRERYTVYPGRGIKNRRSTKQDYIV